jgi:hypothetical protein
MLSGSSPQDDAPSGPLLCMKLSSLRLFSLLFAHLPGNLEAHLEFWNWVGPCVACGIFRDQMSGVLCANFATS